MEKEQAKLLEGTVIHGRGIGKLIGSPTANLEITKGTEIPTAGVYISQIFWNGQTYYGITHIGRRPTLDNDEVISVEVHFLNFNQDIYGEKLGIRLYKKIRSIQKFDDVSALLAQIRMDCITAQDFWGIKRTYSRLQMSIENHCVKVDSSEIYLSSKEFDVLYMLYSNPDVAFTKERIFEAIWHEPSVGCCHAVENTIFQIRKRLKAIVKDVDFIKTVVGYGYKINLNNDRHKAITMPSANITKGCVNFRASDAVQIKQDCCHCTYPDTAVEKLTQ